MRNFNKNTYFEAAPSLSERRGGGHTGHFSPGSGLLLHAPKSAHRGGDARGVGMKNPIFSHSGAWCSCLRVGLGSPQPWVGVPGCRVGGCGSRGGIYGVPSGRASRGAAMHFGLSAFRGGGEVRAMARLNSFLFSFLFISFQ